MNILIVGSSCSGKSTLAKKIAIDLHLQHINIDYLYWKPGWVRRETGELTEMIREKITKDGWIADGNYSILREVLWPRANVVIWLHYPFYIIFWRMLKRTYDAGIRKKHHVPGCVDGFKRTFFSKDSLWLWILHSYRKRNKQYRELLKDNTYKNIQWIILKHPKDVKNIVAQISELP